MRLSTSELLIGLGVLFVVVGSSAASSAADGGADDGGEPLVGKRVLVLGDSLAVGLGIGFQRWHGSSKVRGVTGSTAAYWQGRSKQIVDAVGPVDVVLVSLGTNDWKPPIGEQEYPAKWAVFHDSIVEIDLACRQIAPVVVFVVPRWVEWSETIERNLRQAGVLMVNPPREQPAVDGIHLSVAGYESWSRSVAKEVNERWLKR
jgi:lysophospholipase L1-like esterase